MSPRCTGIGLVAVVLLCGGAAPISAGNVRPAEHPPPNVLLIVADDLGYSDLGAFGGEIHTPNLDALAARGVRLTSFYTAPTCSPTRAMLLTGSDNHKVGLGTMAELVTSEQRGVPGYEGYLNERAATLAERLKIAGYETLMSGKWHLGKDPGQYPSDRGFSRSFALLQGDHNHFGFDQTIAYRALGAARDYRLNGEAAELPNGVYGDDYFTTQMLGFLRKPRGDRPFFAYLAFTGPHWPLQAPAEDIARYRHRYDAGPAATQKSRIERMRALGVVETDVVPYPVDVGMWRKMPPAERAVAVRKMEVYAAMVDRMDQNVGRVVRYLHDSGQLENTIVVFLSDNGAEGYSLERPFDVPDPSKLAGAAFDNRFENIGSGSSYVSLGRLWAQVSSTPFRGVKLEMTEGGIRTPAIVAGPGIRSGMLAGGVTHVTDIVPTVLDLVHTSVEGSVNGKKVLVPEGRSWAGLLAGKVSAVRSQADVLGWEMLYRRALRRGRWKAVFEPSLLPLFKERTPLDQVRWQLFDLEADPGEIRDLAADRPGVMEEIVREWQSYAARNSVVLPGGQTGTVRAQQ